jgi:hypothetical protein
MLLICHIIIELTRKLKFLMIYRSRTLEIILNHDRLVNLN